jgi:hypothetical protein
VEPGTMRGTGPWMRGMGTWHHPFLLAHPYISKKWTRIGTWNHALRDHFRFTLTYNWTPLEEQVINNIKSQHICGRF